MVDVHHQYNFSSILEELFALKPLGGPHATPLRVIVEIRAKEILSHPDARYMPAFKILDLMADMVNSVIALDEEPQLRETEATALLRNMLSDESPRLRQFLLDAALERARYEPMMIAERPTDHRSLRDLTLLKRWKAMREAHQLLTTLPSPWIEIVDASVNAVIEAPCFATYRVGPLMQYFAEMLQLARQLHGERSAPEVLILALSEKSPLWKRYALKPARYRAQKQPMHHPESPHHRPTLH